MNATHEHDVLQLMFSSDEEDDDVGNSRRCAHPKAQNGIKLFLDPRAFNAITQTDTESDIKKQEKQDASFAASLQLQEEWERDRRRKDEHNMMKGSTAGASVLLVEQVITLLQPHLASGIKPVGRDDAVFLAEKILELQDTFKQGGCPPFVDIGYHYTAKSNIRAIRTSGLLTVEDRIAKKNKNVVNRAYFGNGIYVANNPHAFRSYGEVGLLVAILPGNVQDLGTEHFDRSSTIVYPTTNTITGNKIGPNPYYNEIVLRTSSQVLPLVKFPKDKIQDPTFADLLWSIHKQIQHEILDVFFNESQKTCVTRVKKTTSSSTGGFSFAQNGPAPFFNFGSIPTPPLSQNVNLPVPVVPVAPNKPGTSFASAAPVGKVPFTPICVQDGAAAGVNMQSITAMPAYESKSFEELRYENFLKGRSIGKEPFTPTCVQDGTAAGVNMQSITAMPAYESKSFEELRYENFLKGRSIPMFGTASSGGFKVRASELHFGNSSPYLGSFPNSLPTPAFQSSQHWQAFGTPQSNTKSGKCADLQILLHLFMLV